MSSINPTPEQFRALFVDVPADVPVVMLNLLRFRARAAYDDGDRGLTGEQAYARYVREAMPHLEAAGAKVLFTGSARTTVIGPVDEAWDEVLLVEYPSAAKFAAMVTQPAYQALAVHRTAAVADSRLVATVAETP